ncbi:glycosyltransferase [Simiduia curdlanivorans]|uniref:Glycosyltransferase n=1 Tax=Simiduia curdlanivorans TaxID=1492769 RepID=A0ABV8VC33_9GAMM|nr:glycosyltransferase [Simiduia curdlanivorans]MDN3638509.1 glycosyltransferase [Simiduia curdlanivorans]
MASLNQPLRVMHIISGDLWAGAEVQAYTLLKHLQPDCELSVVCLNDGELSARLGALHIPVEIIPEADFNAAQILFRLRKAILVFKPDIIHTHRQKENILGSIANLLANPIASNRAKCLRTAHGAPEYAPTGLQRIQVALDTWVANHLQFGIIAVSEDLGQILKATYAPEKIFVIHNGVDIEPLQAIEPIEFQPATEGPTRHIGIVGRLEQIKRVDLFLQAAKLILTKKNLNCHFHILGDGKQKPELVRLAKSLEIDRFVTFHGHQSNVHRYIKSLDVLVICSDHEGTPMVVLEACALGVCVVANKTGGLPEIIANEDGHLLSNEHSARGYAQTIENILSARKKTPTLNKKFTAEYNAKKTIELYGKKRKCTATLTSTKCT